MERISSGWSDSTGEDIDGNDLEIRIRSEIYLVMSGIGCSPPNGRWGSPMNSGVLTWSYLRSEIEIKSSRPRIEKEGS